MARRIAFVSNALTGGELRAGNTDAARVYALLLNPEIGCCDPTSPKPLHDCESRSEFEKQMLAALANWNEEDQLLLYFSGHGQVVKGKRYALAFGDGEAKTFLPFDNIVADLQTHGVTRAIIILDACESGAAVESGEKGPSDFGIDLNEFPKGMAFVASSRKKESSYELPDGSASLFTHLLSEGLESGLGGVATNDNLIGVDDIVSYVSKRLLSPSYTSYPQTPVYSIHGAERHMWLARNRSRKEEPKSEPHAARSLDELRFLYERTAESRHPCLGASLSELDWELVSTYAKNAGIEDLDRESLQQEAERLGLYSPLETGQLHNAAVLCFAKRPEIFIPQARSIFVVGKRTEQGFRRQDITGPLPAQYGTLIDLVEEALTRHGLRRDVVSRTFFSAIREAISNAVAHRDYSRNGVIRVTAQYPSVEVVSPGGFPGGRSWKSLLEGEHISNPVDAAIAWYLTTVLAFEGVGRGFEVFSEYLKLAGGAFLVCDEVDASSAIRIRITLNEEEVAEHYAAESSVIPRLEVATVSKSEEELLPSALAESRELGGFPRLGRMEVVRVLGQGGMGAVYLARDTAWIAT